MDKPVKPNRQKKKYINAAEQRLKQLVYDHPSLAGEIERCRDVMMPTGPRLAPTPTWDSSWRVEPAEQLELPATQEVIPAVFVPGRQQPDRDRSAA